MMRDIPRISNSVSTSNAYSGADMLYAGGSNTSPFGNALIACGGAGGLYGDGSGGTDYERKVREIMGMQAAQAAAFQPAPNPKPAKLEQSSMATTRRLVQVFIADPDENVPLESAILYSGTQKMTDLNDQELFFEIDIKSILDTHNATRKTIVNKKVKERTEYLEPVKVRDLKMVIVEVAKF